MGVAWRLPWVQAARGMTWRRPMQRPGCTMPAVLPHWPAWMPPHLMRRSCGICKEVLRELEGALHHRLSCFLWLRLLLSCRSCGICKDVLRELEAVCRESRQQRARIVFLKHDMQVPTSWPWVCLPVLALGVSWCHKQLPAVLACHGILP